MARKTTSSGGARASARSRTLSVGDLHRERRRIAQDSSFGDQQKRDYQEAIAEELVDRRWKFHQRIPPKSVVEWAYREKGWRTKEEG